ncbi:MAG TPA: serine/threonine-protein kinase [Candidatus Thermoplasmatota archaeon]|nr:serine/threonine-protein kinase [Candidatus Thermoplasmatota archaeon]
MVDSGMVFGLLFTGAGALSMGLAGVVFLTRPGAVRNRRLAAVLYAEGLAWIASFGLPPLLEAESDRAWNAAGYVPFVVLPFLYLRFIALLPAPFVRPLRRPVVMKALGALPLLCLLAFLANPAGWRDGPWVNVIDAGNGIVSLVALAAVVSTLRHSERGTPARQQARAYTVAFGTRDVLWFVGLLVVYPFFFDTTWGFLTYNVLAVTAAFLFPCLLAYAILHLQVFDIDVRIRRGAVRTAIIAVLVTAFLVASDVAGRALADVTGTWIALAVVAIAAVLLLPLQRVAHRTLDRILPGPSDALLDARKLQVLQAALAEAAAVDGALAPADATRIGELQKQLGISDRDRAVLAHTLAGASMPSGLASGQSVLGRYRLDRPLGGSSADRTWLAHSRNGQRVVVKRYPLLSGGLREKASLVALRHPNVVGLIEAGDEAGGTFLILEHLAGGSLAQRLTKGPLPAREWVPLAQGTLEGLAALHARGIVHRDVKPANVLLDGDGNAVVADFDVAHLQCLDQTVGPASAPPIGTLRYMSPEQARGRPATVASDLYGAAATLYEALVGRPYLEAVAGESAAELRQRAAAGRPFPSTLPEAPDLRDWFAQALDPFAARRFPSAKSMRADLARRWPSGALARPA